MPKARIISIGDLHLADKPPGSRVGNYRDQVLGKIEKSRHLAVARQVAAVLLTGDVFHLKTPTRNSHSLVRSLIEILQEFPCPVFVAPGNHDLSNDRLDSLPRQPLGVVLESGALTLLTPEGHDVVLEDDEGNPIKIRLAATSYNERDPLPECHKVKKGDNDYLITVGHFYSSPQGGHYFGHTCLSYREMSKTETDLWVMGHFHNDQGIQMVRDTYFINLGALSRGSLDEDNITRQVKIGYVELSKPGVKVIPSLKSVRIPMLSAMDVFDLEKHEEIKEEKKRMDSFVQELESEFSRVSSEEGEEGDTGPVELLQKMSLDIELQEEVMRRIREAEAS